MIKIPRTQFVKTSNYYSEYEYYESLHLYVVRLYRPRSYSKDKNSRLIKEFIVEESHIETIGIKAYLRAILKYLGKKKKTKEYYKLVASKAFKIKIEKVTPEQIWVIKNLILK